MKMRGTDYELPADWNALTDEEKSDWYTEERVRRQAMNQRTPFRDQVKAEEERIRFLQRIRKFVKLGK